MAEVTGGPGDIRLCKVLDGDLAGIRVPPDCEATPVTSEFALVMKGAGDLTGPAAGAFSAIED